MKANTGLALIVPFILMGAGSNAWATDGACDVLLHLLEKGFKIWNWGELKGMGLGGVITPDIRASAEGVGLKGRG